jgi:hypothetical protein
MSAIREIKGWRIVDSGGESVCLGGVKWQRLWPK